MASPEHSRDPSGAGYTDYR